MGHTDHVIYFKCLTFQFNQLKFKVPDSKHLRKQTKQYTLRENLCIFLGNALVSPENSQTFQNWYRKTTSKQLPSVKIFNAMKIKND